VPYPIQSGSITDRLRKFFRIRGKTDFALDEMVAPVVIVQDLTVGPYQAGVTPAAGTLSANFLNTGGSAVALILNSKPGSVTEKLDRQFDGRSFSVSWIEIQNALGVASEIMTDLQLFVAPRSLVFAGVPTNNATFFSIQENDGSRRVPVELFEFFAGLSPTTGRIWRGLLGDNLNTLGALRIIEPEPAITIGPEDALVMVSIDSTTLDQVIRISMRGFYQEQPS